MEEYQQEKRVREQYLKCFTNGVNLIENGTELGKKKQYGHAISNFILGMEELIKYALVQVLLMDKNREKGEIQKILIDHKLKHKYLIEFFESTKIEFINKHCERQFNVATHQEIGEEYNDVANNLFRLYGPPIGIRSNYTSKQIDEFIELIRKANFQKNEGLYVEFLNYDATNLKMKSPLEINEQLFTKYMQCAIVLAQYMKIGKTWILQMMNCW